MNSPTGLAKSQPFHWGAITFRTQVRYGLEIRVMAAVKRGLNAKPVAVNNNSTIIAAMMTSMNNTSMNIMRSPSVLELI